jgi:hypothetical protein
MPVSVFHFLPAWWRHGALIGGVQILWKISLAAAAVGLFTRAATVIAAIFGVFLLGLPNNFGKIDHMDGIVTMILCILCVSFCGDALSLDARAAHKRARRESYEYGWPLRLSLAMFTLVFFAAGVSKLRASGAAWMTADNLRYLLLSHVYAHHPPTSLGLMIAQSPWLCRIGAVSTVVLEIAMPLTLFVARLRYPLALAMLLLQIMIALCMGVYFTPYMAAYLVFLPWERWANIFRLRHDSSTPQPIPEPA